MTVHDHNCQPEDLRLLDETAEFGIWECKRCFSHRVVVKRGVKQGARRAALRQRRGQVEAAMREHEARRRFFT